MLAQTKPVFAAEGDALKPLRFAPSAINARLEPPLILFGRDQSSFTFAKREFRYDRFAFAYSEESGALTINWDPGQFKPIRLMIVDAGGDLLLEAPINAAAMRVERDDSEVFSVGSLKSDAPSEGSLRLEFPEKDRARAASLRVCLWDEIVTDGFPDTQLFCGPATRTGGLNGGRFFLDGAPNPPRGEYPAKKEGFELSVVAADDFMFRWTSRMPIGTLHEVFLREDRKLSLTVFGALPAGDVEILTADRGVVFEATIGDLRKFARVVLPVQIPFLTIVGPRGTVVHQKLVLETVPRERDTVFLQAPVPTSTYASSIRLWGPLKPGFTITSSEKRVDTFGNEFRWTFAAPLANRWNRSTLVNETSSENGAAARRTVFDHEVFRGYATYLSARTGISLNSQLAAGATFDLNLIHWFEDIFSAASWSRQRWGIAAGYSKTIVSSKPEDKYELASAELNFRFTQGIEGWNETFGLTAGFLESKYRDSDALLMAGPGFFWNRSLPRWFDSIFGWVDFLKRPKWTNFSAIYYGTALEPNAKASGVQVKAVARIDLSDRSYFEGGWSFFAATYEVSKKRIQTGVGRGYLGYGLRF